MIELDLHLIKSRRIELKLTQQDMADYLEMGSKANYSRYESGKYAFDANTIPMLHKVLGIPITKLFTQKVTDSETEKSSEEVI
ncbi:helix-turn-helix domain-containing protein [Levilactobacillus wangkuiensis]|uniref:helix-turn-helix domain-containing protein n=1 Tax=Levilactobacillus wangkuiensis TaxID=2799566 RepID=UPI00194ECCE3|nr:helix-turn-helix transcriptional regulator [Levilactobacillus wangkuiensis]